LYSTGSVTIEKSADTAISPTPIQQTHALSVVASRIMPAMRTNVAARAEKLTIGTSCERSSSGAYPRACCTAWPHSWAATAAAATLREA
jgi:D-tyrosyl-tRNA(Tyr) deacylase